jgi:hypothetical protein
MGSKSKENGSKIGSLVKKNGRRNEKETKNFQIRSARDIRKKV